MEEKLKAKDLIYQYIDIMPELKNQTGKIIIDNAKNSAIILVNEILKLDNLHSEYVPYYRNIEVRGRLFEYWSKVKEEIINFKLS